MTLQLQPLGVAGWTMRERHMIISDVVEEVDLLLLEEQASSDRVYGGVTPALVEEATIVVESVEEIQVRL